MSDVRLRETRQDHPREVAASDHGIVSFAPELVISGIESGITDERWEFGDAHADVTQVRISFGDEGDSGASADDVCVDGERAVGVSGSHRRIGTDCEEMENALKNFGHLLCPTKLERG